MQEELGYEVLEAGSADQVLPLLRSGTDRSLLVADHLMPGMDGPSLSGKRVLYDPDCAPSLYLAMRMSMVTQPTSHA